MANQAQSSTQGLQSPNELAVTGHSASLKTAHESVSHKTKKSSLAKPTKAEERAASRRHKAIEKQFKRLERKEKGSSIQQDPSPFCPSGEPPLVALSPDPGEVSPSRSTSQGPTATFTPTAAGLRNRDELFEVVNDLKSSLLTAITQGLAALQHNQPRRPTSQPALTDIQDPNESQDLDLWQGQSQPSSRASDSEAEDGELVEGTLSEDDSPLPEPQTMPGLFPSALFRSLLYKAKATADLEDPPPATEGKQAQVRPKNPLFSTPPTRTEEVPTPQVVLDIIQKQWQKPSAHVAPSTNDKKFYLPGKDLTNLLQLPTIEDPIAALVSPTPVSGDPAEHLKQEDKKLEATLRHNHQSAAWAIKAASAATFFNRTTLMWLQQLQERLPPGDARLHHDVNKIIAATQFSADATLDAARFSARAIGASATTRRLLWLKNWQADSKTKWRLSSGPLQGDKLFGTTLDPMLIETKDKRKILPSQGKRNSRRLSPYPKQQPFRAQPSTSSALPSTSSQNYPFQSRPFARRSDRAQDYRDRYRQFPQSKRPFRGAGGRPPKQPR